MNTKALKNIKKIARRTKGATYFNSVSIYFDCETGEVVTADMVSSKHDLFKLTELIRECTEEEVANAIRGMMSM